MEHFKEKASYLGRDIATEVGVCVLGPGASNIIAFLKDLKRCVFEF